MINTKKYFFALALIGLAHTSIHAHEAPASRQEKPVIYQVNNYKENRKKRHVSLIRMLWNHIKFGVGLPTFLSGIALTPMSIGSIFLASESLSDAPPFIQALRPILPFGVIASPLLTYLGYKIMQNSFDSVRDEFIETYFDIHKPSDI